MTAPKMMFASGCAASANGYRNDVPAFLASDPETAPVTGQLEVPRILVDEQVARRVSDDLDVPDFLK